jgi:hypothetical protein
MCLKVCHEIDGKPNIPGRIMIHYGEKPPSKFEMSEIYMLLFRKLAEQIMPKQK